MEYQESQFPPVPYLFNFTDLVVSSWDYLQVTVTVLEPNLGRWIVHGAIFFKTSWSKDELQDIRLML